MSRMYPLLSCPSRACRVPRFRYAWLRTIAPKVSHDLEMTLIPVSSTKEGRGMTTVPGSPTVRRRRLAAEMREIREITGKSGYAVAAALKWSPGNMSIDESAKTGLPPREVERLLDY